MSLYRLSALIILLIGGAGLLVHSSLLRTGRLRAGMFCFYTNLSNLLILLYELGLLLFSSGTAVRLLTAPGVAMSMAACIWITHLIYHFVLLPYTRRSGGKFADSTEDWIGNLCVHYVTPLMVLAQWLFFADKTGLSVRNALAWLVLPLAYFAFTMLRAQTGKPIGSTRLLYPYPFLDYPSLGPKKFWLGILRLLLFYFLLGLILVGIGRATLLLT